MKRLTLFLLAMLWSAAAHAVDDIVVTDATDGTITTVTYNWTSDGSGNAVGVTTTPLPGVVFSATTQAKSSAQPSNNYDVVVYEQFTNASGGSDAVDSSDDLMDGLLANRSNTANAVQTVRMIPNTVNTTVGKIRIEVSNAGASKQGTVTLLIGRGWYIKKGEASIPMTGGSTGQILQYQGPGAAKFVTMSGDATMADGGAVTLADTQSFTGLDVTGVGIPNSFNVAGGYGSGGLTVSSTGYLRTGSGIQSDAVLLAGKSGSSGSVQIYPSTAASGLLNITTSAHSSNTAMNLNMATQAGARTYTIPDAGASASFVMTEGAQTINGAKTFGGDISAANLTSGSWTPTLAGVANVSSTASPTGFYTRVGNIVTGTFNIDVTPTAGANTATGVSLTLPIASNFTATTDGFGPVNIRRSDTSYTPGYVRSDATGDYLVVVFGSIDTGTHTVRGSFSYIIK